MVEKTVSQVTFEIDQIDRLLAAYADLLEQAQRARPDLIQVTALASVSHSFYNGLENIFLIIAKSLDDNTPTGAQWHRDLLIQMTKADGKRAPVLSVETAQRLADYLGFRHVYRHSYSFFLNWDEMEKLVTPLTVVWGQVKSELQQFVANLR